MVGEVDLRLDELARRRRRTEERLAALNKAGDRGVMVAWVQAALDDFAKQLTAAKVGELRDAVVRSFARLWRKGDLVRRIEFDPIDFRVPLFDRHDRPVPKQRLSAGEKQIYAISLLWALAQVSGRPLPVVIDTPHGRLDRDHRTVSILQTPSRGAIGCSPGRARSSGQSAAGRFGRRTRLARMRSVRSRRTCPLRPEPGSRL